MATAEILRPSFKPTLSRRVPKSVLTVVKRLHFPDVATPAPTLHEDMRAAYWLSGAVNPYGEHYLITLGQKVQRDVSILSLWYSGYVSRADINNPALHPQDSVSPLEAFILSRTVYGPFDSPEAAIAKIS